QLHACLLAVLQLCVVLACLGGVITPACTGVGRLVLRDGLWSASLRPFINDYSNRPQRPPLGRPGCASQLAMEPSKP
ncbi:hypothetical protein V8C86DRAFT_2973883, partial [Haematococcus lacustris]